MPADQKGTTQKQKKAYIMPMLSQTLVHAITGPKKASRTKSITGVIKATEITPVS